MRTKWVLLGVWLAVVAVGLVWAGWDYLQPDATEERGAQLRVGMTEAEVEAVLGPATRPHAVFISGRVSYWEKHRYFAYQWERRSALVRVYFGGPNERVRVVKVERLSPVPWYDSVHLGAPPEVIVWVASAFLILSVVVADSFWPVPPAATDFPADRLNSPPVSATTDGGPSPPPEPS